MASRAFLPQIDRVYVDSSVQDSSLARRIRSALPGALWIVLEPGQEPDRDIPGSLYLKFYQGRFLRPCPGTSSYRCCGYRILHIGENCPLDCTYCILQGYFQDSLLKVWANQEDLYAELQRALSQYPGRRFRLGTGEFTDSLALEGITRYTRDLLHFLQDEPRVCLELKSKIVDLSWMQAVKRPERVLPAWSLNSPRIQKEQEPDSASLEQRLQAAAECVACGFRVCLHFDPLILYPGWEEGYKQSVQMIFDYLRPRDIAYLSLGSLRCMPGLRQQIQSQRPESSSFLFNAEYVKGLDGKLRLVRPQRVGQFKYMVDLLRAGGLKDQIYLCMESDQVWQAALGYRPRDLGGLERHLLDLAFQF
ncbi:MAG: radical SAM protein [Thermodesulfobacteriota bacterium]